jgi:hypothetical protein
VKIQILLAAAAMLSFQAVALAVPSSLELTCRQAASLVTSKGAVVLSTSHGVYDRYVSVSSYCETALVAMPAWIPTKDSAECYVGFYCALPNSGSQE